MSEHEFRVEDMDYAYDGLNSHPSLDMEDRLDVNLLRVEMLKLSKLHEANACSWELREKNLRALRARLMALHDAPAEP